MSTKYQQHSMFLRFLLVVAGDDVCWRSLWRQLRDAADAAVAS
jgi:hypothetical protein